MPLQFADPTLPAANYKGGGSQGGFSAIAETYSKNKRQAELDRAYAVINTGEDVDNRPFLQRAIDKASGNEFVQMTPDAALNTIKRYDPKTWSVIQETQIKMEKQQRDAMNTFGKDAYQAIQTMKGMTPEQRTEQAPMMLQGLADKNPLFADKINSLDLNQDGIFSNEELAKGEGYLSSYAGEDKGPLSTPGKLAADLKSGDITQEQYDQATKDKQSVATTLSTAQKKELGIPDDVVIQKKDDGTLKVIYKPSEADETGDQRDRKITNLVEQGLTKNDAANIVDGIVDMEINPKTGTTTLINKATKEAKEIPLANEQKKIPAPEGGRTLFELADKSTGAVSGATELYADIAGQFGFEINSETVEARTVMEAATNSLIKAMATNPRFPVAEMNWIKNEIKLDPSIWRSAPATKSRMKGVDAQLRIRMRQADRDANDPNLPEDIRSSQASNASAIRNFLSQLGAPISASSLHSGSDVGEYQDNQLRTFIESTSDEELDALPDEVAEAIQGRLKGQK